ncbi:TonB-dependent receptor plug domain-containing protein [Siansivirga zeaxanthinifaciens]|uniref:TonB-dependent receptor n=1 Tax=Siansivirga zeaxanthinifaciens CC-SAMT-1 TaxID=1454006 RepID=A0A0C5WBJ2_9FLAO|nr:TonB-dependent receptor plug domain-containing protein [Siansivirga zeaxanthinifaciens]AJR03662.1 TonB-dependent receptor [Siansivirga zeaxanthinifaciens CC-SAMT-1]
MSRKLTISIFYLLFFLKIDVVESQNHPQEKQPLIRVIKILETRYNVRFSYVDRVIKNKTTILPDEDVLLDDALNILKKETHLDFEVLNNRFIVIKDIAETETSTFNIQRLDEIIVSNYLTTGITKLNDGSITIKPEIFGILPGLIEPDVLQTIQAIPGVMSTDETVSNINVRGGTHDQNLLLWDGIKMYQSGHFFGLISAFNPYTTKRVTIYKNGTNAKYGDGISSVIDMQLPNDIDNEFKAGAGFNLINGDAFAKIPLSKKTELQLSLRRSITDFIVTPTYSQYFKRIFQDSDLSNNNNSTSISQNESFYFYDVTLKFLYDITENDKIRIHFLNVNNDLNYDEQSTVNNQSEALNSKLSQENLATSITYTRDWSPKLSTTAQLYVSNYDLNATNFDITKNQRLIQENEVFDGAFKLDINYNSNSSFKINGGYQFNEVGISNLEDVNNPIFRSYIKEVIRSHAIYNEAEYLSNNTKTRVKLGGRLNYFQKFDMLIPEPRLSFSQRFLNHFRVEILGEFKSQTTSQIIDLQNDFLGIEKRRWILSNNENIPILKSKQASAGIHFNKNKLLISTEAYIKKVDGITARSQGFQNQFQFVNDTGNYTIKGVDVLINKKFNTFLSSWISYSYSSNNYHFKNLNNGEALPNNTDIRHAISFANTCALNNIKFALGVNWFSGKPHTVPSASDNPDDDVITYESPNSSRLQNYLRADCSATYNFNITNTARGSFGISVWNILNRKNIINTYYTLDDNNVVNTIENQSLGITPNISFRVHF